MKNFLIWMGLTIIWLIISGVIGDLIFYPHPSEFSFRILSNYTAVGLLFATAITSYNYARK